MNMFTEGEEIDLDRAVYICDMSPFKSSSASISSHGDAIAEMRKNGGQSKHVPVQTNYQHLFSLDRGSTPINA